MGDVVRAGGGLPSIDDFFRGFSLAPVLRDLEQAPRMRVDVEESDQAYILRADVPGADRENIVVNIDGNTVSIRANVEEEKTDQRGNMLRSERIVGEEFRTFTLPQEVDEARADAKIENGVLVLTLPKKSGGGGRKLNIQ
jgi:HSP20 family protein